MQTKKYWVYMLLCSNGNYYTGYTSDLARRYQAHVSGKSKCKYTMVFKPVKIAQSWEISSRSLAMRTEYFIKQLSRLQKEAIIHRPEFLKEIFDNKFCKKSPDDNSFITKATY